MIPLTSEPWKDVDFWGHIDIWWLVSKQSRWAEVEFVSSTSAKVVISQMEKRFTSLDILVVVSSDNGPCLMAEAEQFMRILKNMYKENKFMWFNFKHYVYRFLHAYTRTLHCTTKIALADLIYPSFKFYTRLPTKVSPLE